MGGIGDGRDSASDSESDAGFPASEEVATFSLCSRNSFSIRKRHEPFSTT